MNEPCDGLITASGAFDHLACWRLAPGASTMATKSPPKAAKSTSRPSLLSRARSFTKSASFSRSPSFKSKPKKDPAVEELVRYVMIALPVDGGKQFIHTVDERKITFTAPQGAKTGEEYEFEFTYKGGQRSTPPTPNKIVPAAPVASPDSVVQQTPATDSLVPVPAPPGPDAATYAPVASPPSAAEPVAAMEPVTAEAAPVVQGMPPAEDYKDLAKAVTGSAIDSAMEAVASEGPNGGTSLKGWQQSGTPSRTSSLGAAVGMLVLAMAVVAAQKLYADYTTEAPYLMDVRDFVMEALSPTPPPTPPPLSPLDKFVRFVFHRN